MLVLDLTHGGRNDIRPNENEPPKGNCGSRIFAHVVERFGQLINVVLATRQAPISNELTAKKVSDISIVIKTAFPIGVKLTR